MTIVLEEFKGKVINLISFLDVSDAKKMAVKDVLENGGSPEVIKYAQKDAEFTEGRTYDYVTGVILLYGAYEKFVENLMAYYMNTISKIYERYSCLPEKIQGESFKKTVKLLERMGEGWYRGDTTSVSVAKSLVAFLEDHEDLDIPEEAFVWHTSNFWTKYLAEYFNGTGIHNISSLAAEEAVKNNAGSDSQISEEVNEQRPGYILETIDDLISRRNQISHGDISEFLSNDELKRYIVVFEKFCHSVNGIILNEIAEQSLGKFGEDLGRPIAVYNRNIVCVQSGGHPMTQGDFMAVKEQNGQVKCEVINNLQVDNEDLLSTEKGKDLKVGVEISGRAKDTDDIYLLYRLFSG